MRRWALLFVLAWAVACVPDGDRRDPRLRGGTRPDAGAIEVDGGAGIDGGATEVDAGAADGGAGCGDQVCGGDETCTSCPGDCGPCACPAGFMLHQGRCAPEAPEPFVSRAEAEVCDRWGRDWVDSGGTEWEATFGSNDMCDPGTVSEGAHANAIKRTNLYRWLAGLGPVSEEPGRRSVQQACAVVQYGMGTLSHGPPTDAPCYSAEGAQGAGSSNLAQAGGGLARSVDLYVGDGNVESLGHRRWVLNPSMVSTTFGYKPPFSCMYAFSSGQNTPADLQAWPPPGYVPASAAAGWWSLRVESRSFVAETTTVELDIDAGGFVPVDSWVVGGGYGAGPVLAWDPPAGTWRAGRTVRVRLRNAAGETLSYTVVFTGCA
jgi:hypothetical protein